MKQFFYKCLDCGHEDTGELDGLRCAKCNGAMVPTGGIVSDEALIPCDDDEVVIPLSEETRERLGRYVLGDRYATKENTQSNQSR